MNQLLTFSVCVALATFPTRLQNVSLSDAKRASASPTVFAVRIENVSTSTTLRLSNGTTAPAPTAPVLWIVHTGVDPIFSDGQVDRGLGLEKLAEDGDPSQLMAALRGKPGIVDVGVMTVPVGAQASGPILPGSSYEFTVTASPGDRLTLAMMFGQSNDLFYAPNGRGIALFDGMTPRGDIVTDQFTLWDAGTEVNQEPGLGPDQAPRQTGPNMGTAEREPVQRVHDRFTYPPVDHVIRVTIAPNTTDDRY